MNDHKYDMDEDAFGSKSGTIVSAFDVFPKAKPQYVTRTSGGGKWTVIIGIVSVFLCWSELARWWRGTETHTFAVEKNIGHELQINLDIVVNMNCNDLRINVQDAAGDRILAGQRLRLDGTLWAQWVDSAGVHRLGRDENGKVITGEGWTHFGGRGGHDEGFGQEHVHDIVASGRRRGKWASTPKLRGSKPDSCRIYGSLDLNKVQGDFHITARGHGYHDLGDHLDHNSFNFSHIVSEFSFGPFYPSLVNPLDNTINMATAHFHKFQYFMSVVPTVYSIGRPMTTGSRSIFTNQYAVTEQSHEVSERTIPGLFFKFDIEPILLNIEELRDGYLVFLVKIINVISGALVAGHWGFTMTEWLREVIGRRRRERSQGMLGEKGEYMS